MLLTCLAIKLQASSISWQGKSYSALFELVGRWKSIKLSSCKLFALLSHKLFRYQAIKELRAKARAVMLNVSYCLLKRIRDGQPVHESAFNEATSERCPLRGVSRAKTGVISAMLAVGVTCGSARAGAP